MLCAASCITRMEVRYRVWKDERERAGRLAFVQPMLCRLEMPGSLTPRLFELPHIKLNSLMPVDMCHRIFIMHLNIDLVVYKRLSRLGSAMLMIISACAVVDLPSKAHVESESTGIPLIPREVLLGNPDVTSVSLSPSGQLISFMAPHNGDLRIWIRDLAGEQQPKLLMGESDKVLYLAGWSPNGKYLLAVRDSDGDENSILYRVNPLTSEITALTPSSGVKALYLGGDRRSGSEIVIGLNDRDKRYFDIYALNLDTLDRRLLAQNDSNETISPTWIDGKWAQVFRRGVRSDGGHTWELRLPETGSWQKFLDAPFEESIQGSKSIVGFDESWKYLFGLMSNDAGEYLSLVRWSRADLIGCGLECPYEIVYEAGSGTVVVELVDPVNQRIQVLSEVDLVDRKVFLDESVRADYDGIAKSVNHRSFSVVGTDLGSSLWLVMVYSDKSSSEYWIWDRKQKQARKLFVVAPRLNQYPLMSMQPVEIRARDGLRLPSYLTRAATATSHDKALVLLVHGGPQDRDYWGLEPMHQFLSNRGYNVLSVNFRGSTGLGKTHLLAGVGQWYRKMQDDLIDAIDWAIHEGVADPDKVAIVGSSYGGYAALSGLARDPDRFAAGISIVGPSNLDTLLGSIPPYWEPIRKPLERMIGVGSVNLEDISPLTHAENIRAPLLVVHGANDVRVNVSESESIVQSLQKRSVPVDFVVFPDEGHGIVNPKNSIALFAVIEKFLATHLGGRYEEDLNDAVSGSSAQLRIQSTLNLMLDD